MSHKFQNQIRTFLLSHLFLCLFSALPTTLVQTQISIIENQGHTDIVTVVAQDKQGKFVISGGYDGRVIIWDYHLNREFASYSHGGMVRSLLLLDDQYVVSAAEDGLIYFYDLRQDRMVRSFQAKAPIFSLAIDQERDLLAYGGYDGKISLLSLEDFRPKAEINDQSGISRVLKFKDGLLLSGSSSGAFMVHDPASGALLNTEYLGTPIRDISFSPKTNQVLVMNNDLHIFLLKKDSRELIQPYWSLTLDKNISHLAGYLPDQTIIIFFSPFNPWLHEEKTGFILIENDTADLSTAPLDSLYKDVYQFSTRAEITSFAINEPGTQAILGLKDGSLAEMFSLNDIENRLKRFRQFSFSNLRWIIKLDVSPNGEHICFVDGQVQLIDTKDFTIQTINPDIASFSEDQIPYLGIPAFLNDSLLAFRRLGQLDVYDLTKDAIVASLPIQANAENINSGQYLFLPAISDQNGQIITGTYSRDSIRIIALSPFEKTQKHYFSYPGSSTLWNLKTDSQGKYLISATNEGEIVLFDLQKEQLLFKDEIKLPTIHSTVAISSDAEYFAFTRSGNDFSYLEIYETATLRRHKIIDLTTGFKTTQLVNQTIFNEDKSQLICFMLNGDILELDLEQEKVTKRIKGHYAYIFSVTPFINDKIFLTGAGDNIIKFWDMDTKENFLTMGKPFRYDGTFNNRVLYTPNGYYSTMGVEQLDFQFTFKQKNQLFEFNQFDLKYNRPDKVFDYIRPYFLNAPYADSLRLKQIEAYKNAYLKRIEKLDFTEEEIESNQILNVPSLRVKPKGQLSTQSSERNVVFTLEAEDQKDLLDRIKVLVNGVPLFGVNGLDLTHLKTRSHQQEIEITLSNSSNKIQFSVYNQSGGESGIASFNITYTGDPKEPDLYLVTIGVENYGDEALNLAYPVKDIHDIQELLKENPQVYKEVNVHEMIDEQFDTMQLQKAKSMLQKSTVDDIVIIYYSGHGLMDEDFNYYLATSKTDFSRPKDTAISFELLETLTNDIASRKKLIVIDACHSGEIDPDDLALKKIHSESSFEGEVKFRTFGTNNTYTYSKDDFLLMKQLFSDLRVNEGTTVLSSASGVELAVEGDKWSNGIFTYCIIEGLRAFKADKNNNGIITILELQSFVENEVSRRTFGLQTPNFRKQNIYNDWILWIKNTEDKE